MKYQSSNSIARLVVGMALVALSVPSAIARADDSAETPPGVPADQYRAIFELTAAYMVDKHVTADASGVCLRLATAPDVEREIASEIDPGRARSASECEDPLPAGWILLDLGPVDPIRELSDRATLDGKVRRGEDADEDRYTYYVNLIEGEWLVTGYFEPYQGRPMRPLEQPPDDG